MLNILPHQIFVADQRDILFLIPVATCVFKLLNKKVHFWLDCFQIKCNFRIFTMKSLCGKFRCCNLYFKESCKNHWEVIKINMKIRSNFTKVKKFNWQRFNYWMRNERTWFRTPRNLTCFCWSKWNYNQSMNDSKKKNFYSKKYFCFFYDGDE